MTNETQHYRQAGFAFDLDGTLIDTEQHKSVCHNKTIAYFGGQPAQGIYYKYIGNSFEYVFEKLKHISGIHASLKEYREVFNRFYLEELDKGLRPSEGVVELLEKIAAKGLKMGLVTSSERWMLDRIIEKTGLGKYFTVMVSGNDVAHNKPAPDPYLKAIRSLASDRIFAFEDTKPGLDSASAAGAVVFGIKNSHNTEEELQSAKEIFTSFKKIDLEKILSSY
ncbi:HAD family hydrolase [Chitinophaga rhizosphaerae]|uniref:HAD family hydrolase n=1 Tax=Chitinophaga rhizosphaerae TaxID=1864947 RepID=UPI000F804567|nr:HAD family hydrolase [Chitinophaga rhizosphaerae]